MHLVWSVFDSACCYVALTSEKLPNILPAVPLNDRDAPPPKNECLAAQLGLKLNKKTIGRLVTMLDSNPRHLDHAIDRCDSAPADIGQTCLILIQPTNVATHSSFVMPDCQMS